MCHLEPAVLHAAVYTCTTARKTRCEIPLRVFITNLSCLFLNKDADLPVLDTNWWLCRRNAGIMAWKVMPELQSYTARLAHHGTELDTIPGNFPPTLNTYKAACDIGFSPASHTQPHPHSPLTDGQVLTMTWFNPPGRQRHSTPTQEPLWRPIGLCPNNRATNQQSVSHNMLVNKLG